mmetsp:Transcript_1915/g.1369  ORF Transcript_1915/g.1369 Transcript_1915/m.1369 type:complete len:100 (+) Transcript_1915:48-347(+)
MNKGSASLLVLCFLLSIFTPTLSELTELESSQFPLLMWSANRRVKPEEYDTSLSTSEAIEKIKEYASVTQAELVVIGVKENLPTSTLLKDGPKLTHIKT